MNELPIKLPPINEDIVFAKRSVESLQQRLREAEERENELVLQMESIRPRQQKLLQRYENGVFDGLADKDLLSIQEAHEAESKKSEALKVQYRATKQARDRLERSLQNQQSQYQRACNAYWSKLYNDEFGKTWEAILPELRKLSLIYMMRNKGPMRATFIEELLQRGGVPQESWNARNVCEMRISEMIEETKSKEAA